MSPDLHNCELITQRKDDINVKVFHYMIVTEVYCIQITNVDSSIAFKDFKDFLLFYLLPQHH